MDLQTKLKHKLDAARCLHNSDIELFNKLRSELLKLNGLFIKIDSARDVVSVYFADEYNQRQHKHLEVYINSQGVYISHRLCHGGEWEHDKYTMVEGAFDKLACIITRHVTASGRYEIENLA